jgi:hypothetical protein
MTTRSTSVPTRGRSDLRVTMTTAKQSSAASAMVAHALADQRTGSFQNIDLPKSPRARLPVHTRNCFHSARRAQRLADRAMLRRGVVARSRRVAWRKVQQQEDEQRHDRHHRDHRQQASDDIGDHARCTGPGRAL